MIENTDDRPLVLLAQNGDKNAYGQLVLKHQRRVFRLILAMLGKKDMTEDIVQDAFVKGYLAIKDFLPDKPFYPWISTIARNLAINGIKRAERERPMSEFDDFILETTESPSNPLDEFIDGENEKRLFKAIMALPIQFRSVFILRMFEDMKYEDIAKYLNISVGTVDSRLHRAREKLMELLKDSL
jgi:RNA polymerase sigma-70 factor (ECF subfamily)